MYIDRAAVIPKTWDEILDADVEDVEEPLFSCASYGTPGSISIGGQFHARCRKEHPDYPSRAGTGFEGAGCGNVDVVKCKHCGKTFEVEHKCGLRTCPKCYKKWASNEANKIFSTVQRMKLDGRLVHVAISIRAPPEDIFRLRSHAEEIAKEHGVVGGVIAGHHQRLEGSEWVEDGYVHFHVVGEVGPEGFKTLPQVIAEDQHRSGRHRNRDYVIKFIKQHGWTYFLSEWELPRRLYYILEHCAVAFKRHAITWFGQWWTKCRTVDIGGEGTSQPPVCPYCGSQDVIVLRIDLSPRNKAIMSKYSSAFRSMSERERKYSRASVRS